MPFLLHQRFLETAAKSPERIALQIKRPDAEYKRYTYGEVLNLSRALGFYFIRQGIKRRDQVIFGKPMKDMGGDYKAIAVGLREEVLKLRP